MSNKYLEKIAEKKKKDGFVGFDNYFVGTLAGGAVAAPLLMGSQHYGEKLMKENVSDKTSSGADMGTIKKMMRDNNLRDVTFSKHHPYSNMAGPGFYPSRTFRGTAKDIIGGVRIRESLKGSKTKPIANRDVLLHELGHAQDLSKHRNLKIGVRVATQNTFSKLTPRVLLSHDKTRDYAAPVQAVISASEFRDELAANKYAHKAIVAHKGVEAGKIFNKNLRRNNMLNYGLSAAAQIGSIWAANKYLDYAKKNGSR